MTPAGWGCSSCFRPCTCVGTPSQSVFLSSLSASQKPRGQTLLLPLPPAITTLYFPTESFLPPAWLVHHHLTQPASLLELPQLPSVPVPTPTALYTPGEGADACWSSCPGHSTFSAPSGHSSKCSCSFPVCLADTVTSSSCPLFSRLLPL